MPASFRLAALLLSCATAVFATASRVSEAERFADRCWSNTSFVKTAVGEVAVLTPSHGTLLACPPASPLTIRFALSSPEGGGDSAEGGDAATFGEGGEASTFGGGAATAGAEEEGVVEVTLDGKAVATMLLGYARGEGPVHAITLSAEALDVSLPTHVVEVQVSGASARSEFAFLSSPLAPPGCSSTKSSSLDCTGPAPSYPLSAQ
ncbi:hypothetical protein T484DRAFT_3175724 [Baffinella frigidus]|nr:hypothetical protein T484DRAFT_3175724 [Cryptophyta sp. CCMP2293]